MGCSAGKHVTSSPEISSSSHSTKENGWHPHSPDVPKPSLESTAHSNKRKDSSNSIFSVKEPDIPAPKNEAHPSLLKDKNDSGILGKKNFPIRSDVQLFGFVYSSAECTASKPVPLNQVRTQMTQSQLEFFKMLDKKIDEGPDYASETES